MAETRKRARTARSTTKAPAAKPAAEVTTAPATATVAAENDEAKPKYRVRVSLDPNTIVTVKNGFNGRLIYKSKKTGERFEWEQFGDEQDMELQELKNARNSSKAFFSNNWFLIDDPEIIEYLGVEQYYKYALSNAQLDELFSKGVADIKKAVEHMSRGQKRTLAYRAKQMIADGTIDSIKTINALEECLAIELIER